MPPWRSDVEDGDSAGGVDQLMLAIEEADTSISDKLFSGVISQIPLNLYLRASRSRLQSCAKCGNEVWGRSKTTAGDRRFYLGLERGDEAARVATYVPN